MKKHVKESGTEPIAMIRLKTTLFLITMLCAPANLTAGEILVVHNTVIKAYEIASQGISGVILNKPPRLGPKTIQACVVRRIVLNDLPGQTVITQKTLETIRDSGSRRKVPAPAFADKYLQYGTVVSVAVAYDLYSMGKQAGEMAIQILNGAKSNKTALAPATRISMNISRSPPDT